MQQNIPEFQTFIKQQGQLLYRDMPWRNDTSLYSIVVSEIMLQQTQVNRVKVKYAEFMSLFPDFNALAQTSWSEVLEVWQGLGYQRRAKWLWEIAKIISANGEPEHTIAAWDALPGIGANTAGSILAYTYNLPVVFIETNIRRIFIHHFFADQAGIDDKQLLPLIQASLDRQQPQQWYWALMDYGTELAKTVPNPNRQSKHYAKQSTFRGSQRELRAKVMRALLKTPLTQEELQSEFTDVRLPTVLTELTKELMVKEQTGVYSLE
jgi:A/G-specific adenine glycosylase